MSVLGTATSRRRRRLLAVAGTGVLALAGLVAPHAAGAAGVRVAVVVHGLNNPRGLALVHDDVLLVAEAGKGGALKTFTDPEGGTVDLGYTGSITAVTSPATADNVAPHRIVRGLLSGAAARSGPDGPKGSDAVGPDGVAARSLSDLAIIETTFLPYTPRAALGRDGRLLDAKPGTSITPIANITAYERNHDPDRQGADSNPYAVINYGTGWLVADAAGNDILRVSSAGHVTVFHVFHNVISGPCALQYDPTPTFPGCNFVPTSLATDAHGNVYVGGLSSLMPHQAQVFKLDDTGTPVKRWTGFTSITGVAVSPNGATIFVSQLYAAAPDPIFPGVVTRISGSTRTDVGVPLPAGMALDSHGNLFVSVFSVEPATGAGIPTEDTSGQVWRLRF